MRPRTGLSLEHITITVDGFTQALGAVERLARQTQELARGGIDDIELELD
jgi:hypothetical protein